MNSHLDLITLLGIAVAVSMDALVVSIGNGFFMKEFRVSRALRIAFSFGFFQALMPLIGWLAGYSLAEFICAWDHWVAFALLVTIGVKMIWECRKVSSDTAVRDCSGFSTLLLLSIATSIDALAVGVSFALLDTSIFYPITVIGIVTFIVCFAGVLAGSKMVRFHGAGLELTGGLILIAIGVKILLEHLIKGI
ncbi:MAG: manganese efflux pump [Spirochaetales bacterium]|nr:manganese efflux pump [Spirochaetales bacterium]